MIKHPQCLMEYCQMDKLYGLIKDVLTSEDQWLDECGATYGVRRNVSETRSAENELPSKLRLNDVPPLSVTLPAQNGASSVGALD